MPDVRSSYSDELQPERPFVKALWIGLPLALGLYFLFQIKQSADEFLDGQCENIEVHQTFSPDRKLRLVEYLRACGVGSSEIREYAIVPTGTTLPNENGNAFRCGVKQEWALENRISTTKVKWLDNRRVEIAYPEGIEVFDHHRRLWVREEGESAVMVEVAAKSGEP